MNILSLDTSLFDVSVALRTSDGRLLSQSVSEQRSALRLLMDISARLLRQANLSPSDIDFVVCARGPGSFTGLRVGVAAAKAFADAVGVSIAGVSTLLAIADEAFRQCAVSEIVSVIECCRNELYVGHYRFDDAGAAICLTDDRAMKADKLLEWLEKIGSSVVVAGPAVIKYLETVANWHRLCNIQSIEAIRLIDIALRAEKTDPLAFRPVYLRASQAEVRAEKSS